MTRLDALKAKIKKATTRLATARLKPFERSQLQRSIDKMISELQQLQPREQTEATNTR